MSAELLKDMDAFMNTLKDLVEIEEKNHNNAESEDSGDEDNIPDQRHSATTGIISNHIIANTEVIHGGEEISA